MPLVAGQPAGADDQAAPAPFASREAASFHRFIISSLDRFVALLVVARHAAEHLGQAELTRDLWLASRQS